MYLPNECEYGIRIIQTLASAFNEQKTAKEICEINYIPKQFGYKILKKLEYAGFVQSIREFEGGSSRVKDLDTFTIADLACATYDRLLISICLRDGKTCKFKNDGIDCLVWTEFERIKKVLGE